MAETTMPAASDRSLEFGIQIIQTWTWPETRERMAWFESLGFESLWLTDHLTRTANPGEPYLEAWTLLSALAVEVTQARLGVLVSSNTFRHPSVLAKMAVTVDHISNGRLELGVGAGWFKTEHDMFGLEFPDTGELVERYAEALDLLDRFLTNDITTFQGEHYSLQDAPNRPPPIQQPRMPIMIGAHGPRMINIAARFADTWNTRGTPDEVRMRNRQMDEACAKIDRDPTEVKRSLLYVIAQMPEEHPWDSIDAFVDFVGRFREAGIQQFIVQPPDPTEFAMVERVALEVIPSLRRGS
ncbi:MAG TPA: LLM class flavin-dependent oxidoreductase [Thermomicrobiales bacterium]|nr:LLM class flavin-dependent oxidoreductase [Thermomicrobiales bacterium]